MQTLNSEIQKTSVYPNPASDNVTIESTKEIESILIFNTAGVNVFEHKIENLRETTFNISHFRRGIYFVQINCLNAELTKHLKLVIK